MKTPYHADNEGGTQQHSSWQKPFLMDEVLMESSWSLRWPLPQTPPDH